jgi:hypothetical protein
VAADLHTSHCQQGPCIVPVFNDSPASEEKGDLHTVAGGNLGVVHRQRCFAADDEALVGRAYGLMYISGQDNGHLFSRA